MANPKHILDRLKHLKTLQENWKSIWADVSRLCNELENPFTRINAEGSNKKMPIDVSGQRLVYGLAGNLFSNTVFQGSEWFSLLAKKRSGISSDNQGVISFLEGLMFKAIELINSSNFTQIYQEFLINYVCFGTGVVLPEWDKKEKILVCRQFSITSGIYLDNNSKGQCDTVFREFEFDARKAVQEFGYKNLPESIQKAYNDARYGEKFKFCHAVYPRADEDINTKKRTPRNRKFASIYIEISEQKIVLEDGYEDFPFMVPRFYKQDEETYGRSPAMFAVPIFKLINRATEAYIRKEEFRANPVIFTQAEFINTTIMEPGVMNASAPNQQEPFVWDGAKDNGQILLEFINNRIDQADDLFFKKLFQYLEDRKNMSATEAQLRYEESIQSISSVLSRLQKEFFSVFIPRICNIILKNNLIEIPSSLQDTDELDFDILYTTRLDTKLKAVMSANIINCLRLVGEALEILNANPNVGKYFVEKEIVDLIAQNNNVTSKILATAEAIQAQEEAQAQAQQSQMMQQMTKPIDLQATNAPGSTAEAMMMAQS